MISGVQPKLLLDKDLNVLSSQLESLGIIENDFNYELIREHDGLVKRSKDIKWISFKDNGTFDKEHKQIELGTSLIMSPFNAYFTWQTTEVVDIIEQKEKYIKFKTKNSIYELIKL